jgi:opacity protein-like surface antigen
MRKLVLILSLIVSTVATTGALAQNYAKWNWYLGAAHGRQESSVGSLIVSEGGETFPPIQPCSSDGADALGSHLQRIFCDKRDFHGLQLAGQYNVSRWVGIRGDFTGLFNRDRAVDAFGTGADEHTDTSHITDRTYLLLGGLEIGDNAAPRWRPFAHAMIGAARVSSDDRQTSTGPFNFSIRDHSTSPAMNVGAGLDINVTPRFDVRLIEVDYVPVFGRDRTTPTINADFDQRVKGRTAKNVNFSFGIVWH